MSLPLLLGHRGARAFRDIPENTLPSFERSLQHGCDGFEFDVRLSGDGRAVICHDASLGGISISKTVAGRLALPALEDVLRQFADRAFLDIELKVAGAEELVLAGLLKHPPRKGYLISSFLPEALAAVHSVDPGVPLGFLCETRRQLRDWREASTEWVIPQCELVDRELVEELHAAGKKVMVWTVNRAERMRVLAEWRVDAIISDESALLVCSLR